MSMKLNMNYRSAFFFQVQDGNMRANLCKNGLYPATIKNDNGAFAMRFYLQRKQNQQRHYIKNDTIV